MFTDRGFTVDEFQIYPHQRDALLQLKDWYNNNPSRIGLVVIPTGGGKSGIAALAPYILNTTRVLVITPSLPITRQLAAAFVLEKKTVELSELFLYSREPTKSFYVKQKVVTAEAASRFVEPCRIINQGREIVDLSENLVLVNAQKFTTNSSIDWEKLNRKSFNLLIVDEAHHFPAPTWEKIVSYFQCKTIFLTATPYRRSKPILQRQNGVICYQISCNELISRGVIRRMTFRQIGTVDDRDTERRSVEKSSSN